MPTTEASLIAKTKALMNEMGDADTLALLAEDNLRVDEYIQSVIPEAVSLVQANSRARCVNRKASTGILLTTDNNAASLLALPDDYVQLIAVKLANWKRVCIGTHGMDSEAYREQCNPYTRTGKAKPVAIYGYDNNGNRTLFLYPCDTAGATPETFVYEAHYNPDDGLNLDLDDPLCMAVCYMAASLVYTIFENPAAAQQMQAVALALIPKQ